MGTGRTEGAADASITGHEQAMEYLSSSAWEERLDAARAKRALALAAREAGTELGPLRHLASSKDPEERAGAAPGRGDPAPLRTPAASPGVARAVPGLSEAPGRRLGKTTSRRPAAAVAALFGVILVCGTAVFVATRTIDGEPPSSDGTEASRLDEEIEGSWTGPPKPEGAPSESGPIAPSPTDAGRDALTRAVADLGAGYTVRIVAAADAAPPVDAGAGSFDLRLSRFSSSNTAVAFFHAEDAAAAGRVSERLGAESLDLTGLAPSPPSGTIEIRLTGG